MTETSTPGIPEGPKAIALDPADNVAVALRALAAGEQVAIEGAPLILQTAIPTGHKLALEEIAAGAPVRKYGETVGIASARIAAGEHVHVHNVRSSRLPG